MANSTARMLLKNGKSFPQLLRTILVGQPNIKVCNKEQLILQSFVNPTQKIYEQKPILGDGFNFVDFVLGKDHELCSEQWKSSAVLEARGRRAVSDEDEDEDEEGIEDFDYDVDGFNVNDDDSDEDEDKDDDDGDDHGVRI